MIVSTTTLSYGFGNMIVVFFYVFFLLMLCAAPFAGYYWFKLGQKENE